MGKDRYSDDHTVEVVGGTNTVNVKENLAVENDLAVGNDLTVNNNLSVDNNVTVSGSVVGGLDVIGGLSVVGGVESGSFTASIDFVYSSDQTFIKNIPVLFLKTAADITQYADSGPIACSLTDTLVPGYLSFNFGTMTTGQWYFDFPIDDFIQQKGTITGIYFLAEVDSSFSESQFEFTVTVNSFDSEGSSPPSITAEDSDSITLVKADGRQWLKADLSVLNPDVSPTAASKCYYVRFSKTNSKVVIASIFKCVIEYTTSELKEALNCTSVVLLP